ncbi:MAG: 30S ribosomal protein S12 methylthiotransferase RimO [Clostridia bacterium]|nr:30S ribosomal protein S12 methylthiotransferase RimO [Clostridia bacterium]
MKVGFVSLGCPKNQLDTEVMLSELNAAGYEICAEETEADVIILNTCGFIKDAKTEAIDNILDLAWLKENARLKKLVVCGCLVQRYGDEILAQFPEVDAIMSVGAIHDVVSVVQRVVKGERFSVLKKPEEAALGGDRIVTTPEHYAYMKIAEGCDNRCTYCAIPDIRGAFRSRPIEELIAEAKDMEALGVRELILVAQDTTRYGLDIYGDFKLDMLIQRITDETNIPWIRVLYCYPDKITDGLCEQFRSNDRLVKYIDMPIQHISDGVLKRMNRHGGRAVIEDAVARLRKACPGIIIRTTVIVGFPGETGEQFEELINYLADTKFERLGAFTYSKEEGTPAEKLDGHLPEQKKKRRYDAVMKQQNKIAERINSARVGKREIAMVEGYDPVSDSYFCRTEKEAPEIDGKLYLVGAPKNAFAPGDMVDVVITDAIDYDLVCEIAQIGK